jgi:hypothetical protein
MSGISGISAGGADAEAMFVAATGATKTERAALGDAVLDGHFVEVKQARSPTLNQVRAVKYIVLVAFFVPDGQWYVVPANEIVRQCARKGRGQHTENPFESATMSLKNLSGYKIANVNELKPKVLEAVAEAETYPELGDLMRQVLVDSKDVAKRSTEAVREALGRLGLD